MCVTYYQTHPGCQHKTFLGSQPCGLYTQNHPAHVFYIEDTGFPCVPCLRRGGDPPVPCAQAPGDRHLIRFPIPSNASNEVEHTGEANEANESRDLDHWETGSLSDVDSVTSHWRLDGVEEQAVVQNEAPATTLPSGSMQANGSYQAPGLAQHRQLVQYQLSNLPGNQQPAMQAHQYQAAAQATGTPQPFMYANGQYPVHQTQHSYTNYYGYQQPAQYNYGNYYGYGQGHGYGHGQGYGAGHNAPYNQAHGQANGRASNQANGQAPSEQSGPIPAGPYRQAPN